MKFLISIIMVLLLMNLFAQAEDNKTANDNPGNTSGSIKGNSSTAMPIDDSVTAKAPMTSSYSDTQAGTKRLSDPTKQGGRQKCDENNPKGGCNPSPNHAGPLISNNKGKFVKGGGGDPSTATKVKSGEATK